MPGRGRPFPKGNNANPAGRPVGSQNRLTKIMQEVLTPAARPILRKIVKAARDGDQSQQKVFAHLLPPLPAPKYVDPPIANFPQVTNAHEAVTQIALITQQMARGELDTESAHALVDKLKAFIVGYAAVELEMEVARAKSRSEGGEP
jgi:hypothetical protein